MPDHIAPLASVSMVCLAAPCLLVLASCGGGGSGIASAPNPATSPTPQPSSPPTFAPASPKQSTAPQVIEAAVGGPNFSSGDQRGVFPVTQTAVTPNFQGDPADTGQGKAFAPDLLGDGPFLSYSGGGYSLGAILAEFDLDWTRFGYWDAAIVLASNLKGRGAWVAGFQTPLGAIPATGTASYSGKVMGIYDELPRCQCNSFATLSGDVTLAADFGTRTISGAMTKLTVGSNSFATDAMNDIAFSASFSNGRNQFTGTTTAGSAPASPWALSAGAAGEITGHFYGPSAQEVGAAWTLSDTSRRVIGSFGARRQ